MKEKSFGPEKHNYGRALLTYYLLTTHDATLTVSGNKQPEMMAFVIHCPDPSIFSLLGLGLSGSGEPASSGPTGDLLGDVTVRAALITACVTIVGIVLKDLVFKFIDERRATTRAEAAVYDRYSKPLAAAASSFLVRLDEIILQRHRPVYLKGTGIPTGRGRARHFGRTKSLARCIASPASWVGCAPAAESFHTFELPRGPKMP